MTYHWVQAFVDSLLKYRKNIFEEALPLKLSVTAHQSYLNLD